ncbi:MAG: hypothetical protein ABI977_06820 [Acidobacteriota bacterium]
MPMFVHLTHEKNLKAILRNGICRLRKQSNRPHGIFAMPVTRNFFVSHQWLRELKRRGPGSVLGVYFRIPDEEAVWVGHYNQSHQQMTAAEAAALIANSEKPEGYEVIIPRRIEKTEIHRTRVLPQVIGWRYYPGAHGKKPCGCSFCQRGNYGARRLQEEFEQSVKLPR